MADRAVRATFLRRQRRALAPTSKSLRNLVHARREELFELGEKLDKAHAELREVRASLKHLPTEETLLEALGEVRCRTCGLEARDAGPGCVECMDRRRTYEVEKLKTREAKKKAQDEEARRKRSSGASDRRRCSRCNRAFGEDDDG